MWLRALPLRCSMDPGLVEDQVEGFLPKLSITDQVDRHPYEQPRPSQHPPTFWAVDEALDSHGHLNRSILFL